MQPRHGGSVHAQRHKIQTGFSLANDLPTFEEEPPVAFTDEDLKKLFATMDAEDTARYKFILGTAARDARSAVCLVDRYRL